MHKFASACFLAALLVLCGCTSPSKVIAPGFDVAVIDAMTKQPIAGASATVYADNNPDNADRELADANGRVRVAALDSRTLCLPHCRPVDGRVSVRFGAQGYSAVVMPMRDFEETYVRANRPVELQHAPAPQ